MSINIATILQGYPEPQKERHDACSDMPEYRLLEALLQEAAETYIYGNEKRRDWIDAARWFQRRECHSFCVDLYYDGVTFAFVCDALGLDASYVRKTVLAAREAFKTVDTPVETAV